MKKEEFQKLLQENMLILDGATGSNLQKNGMPSGICVEQWVCEHEDVLIELQREYVESGSNVVYASTFSANRIKLKEFGLEDQVSAMNRQLVAISKKAVGDKALVAGDVTMTGQQLEPLGSLKFEELIDVYKEQMTALEAGGADFIIIETMMSLQETRAALIAARESVELPVMVTMSFGEDGRTLYGTDAKTAAVVIEGLGADAVGVNCSAGPDKMLPLIRDMRSVVSLPIVAKPNAGMPKLGADAKTEYDMSVETFEGHMVALAEAGASILGGCCGTSPDYIRAVSKIAGGRKPEHVTQEPVTYITSERNTLKWSDTCKFGTVSSMDDDELAQEWEDDMYDTLYDTIDDCDDVDALCICVDGNEGDTAEIMRKVVRETVSYTSLPLVFQSKDIQVLESALRCYPGKGGIVSSEGQSAQLQPLAEKYGAVILCS